MLGRPWVPTPTSPAHTLCQSSLNELVREACQELNDVSFYVQKSSHIYEGCIYCLVRVLQAREEKKKSWIINKWGHSANEWLRSPRMWGQYSLEELSEREQVKEREKHID